MKLTGNQYRQLHQALVNAFPPGYSLEALYTFTFGGRLGDIAHGESHNAVVLNLLTWAEATGNLSRLLAAAVEQNPGNSDLRRLAAAWLPEQTAPPRPSPVLRMDLGASFDQDSYSAEDDPLARFLLEFRVPTGQLAEIPALPTALTLLLDVSGSMNRPDRYPLLRQAVRELSRRLHPADRLAIVLFSDQVATVLSADAGRVGTVDIDAVLARMDSSPAIFGLKTLLAPAFRAALQQVRSFDQIGPHSRRVYVLTDGELHDGQHCAAILKNFSPQEIEVHAYGFGAEFNPQALKGLVLGQLGGSVKPICTASDIVATFAHIATVAGRVVAEEAELTVEFHSHIDPHEAWAYRPQERLLGRVRGRKLRHAIGAVEAGRAYSFLFEVRLPHGGGAGTTPVAQASVRWKRSGEPGEEHAAIETARSPRGSYPPPLRRDSVTQAYTILHRLSVPADDAAELEALRARRDMARLEHRHPEFIAALEKQISVLEGHASSDTLTQEDVRNLNSDASTVPPFPDERGSL